MFVVALRSVKENANSGATSAFFCVFLSACTGRGGVAEHEAPDSIALLRMVQAPGIKLDSPRLQAHAQRRDQEIHAMRLMQIKLAFDKAMFLQATQLLNQDLRQRRIGPSPCNRGVIFDCHDARLIHGACFA